MLVKLGFPAFLTLAISKEDATIPFLKFIETGGILPASHDAMNKPKPIVLLGAAAVAAIGALSFPSPSSGQAAGDEQAIAQLVTEIAGQQTKILTNQQAIGQKVALIEENLRVARIYISRGGGKK